MNESSFRKGEFPVTKKELIRESAIKVIAAEGYYNTTVKMIAEEADIAVGTVYNYFTNKKEILNYIFKVEFDKRIELLESLRKQEKSLREILIFFLNKHFSWLENSRATTTVLVQESSLPHKHSLTAINDFMNKLPQLLAEMIETAQQKGEIRKVNSEIIANAIFHSIRGVALKVEGDDLDYNFNMAKRELINFIWVGLIKE